MTHQVPPTLTVPAHPESQMTLRCLQRLEVPRSTRAVCGVCFRPLRTIRNRLDIKLPGADDDASPARQILTPACGQKRKGNKRLLTLEARVERLAQRSSLSAKRLICRAGKSGDARRDQSMCVFYRWSIHERNLGGRG